MNMKLQKYKFFAPIAAAIFGILIFFIFLPNLLSTPSGRALLISYLEKKKNAKISIEKLQLSWFGPQTIEGFYLSNQEWEASFSSLHTESTLFSFKNLIKLEKIAHLRKNAQLKDGRIAFFSKNAPIIFSSVFADFIIQDSQSPLVVHVSAKSEQEESYGQLDLSFSVENQKRKKEFSEYAFKAKGKSTLVPVEGIERLIALKTRKWRSDSFPDALGTILNCNCSLEGTWNEILLVADLETSRLRAHIEGISKDDAFQLKKPAQIELQLSTAFVNNLSQFIDIPHLNRTTEMHLSIENLSLPLKDFSYEKLAFTLSAEIPDIDILFEQENLAANHLKIYTAKEREKAHLEWDFSTKFSSGGDFQSSGHIENIVELFSQKDLSLFQGNIHIQAHKVPFEAFNLYSEKKPLLRSVIGEEFSMDATLFRLGLKGRLDCIFSSTNISSFHAKGQVNDSFHLLEPVQLQYTVTPELMQLSDSKQVFLGKEILLSVVLEELTLPLFSSNHSYYPLEKLQWKGSIAANEIFFADFFGKKNLLFNNFKAEVDAENANTIKTHALAQWNIQEKTPFFPSSVGIEFEGIMGLLHPGDWEIKELFCKMHSSLFTASTKCALKQKPYRITLTTPLSIQYEISNEMVQSLESKIGKLPHLKRAAMMQVELEPFSFFLNQPFLEQLNYKGKAKIKGIVMSTKHKNSVGIEDAELCFAFDKPANRFRLDLHARSDFADNRKGNIDIEWTFEDLFSSHTWNKWADITSTARLKNVPYSLVTPLLGKRFSGTRIFGTLFDIQAKIHGNLQEPIVHFLVNSENIHFDGQLSLKKGIESIGNKPMHLQWKIDPALFSSLEKHLLVENDSNYQLLKPMRIKAQIPHLFWPLKPALALDTSPLKSLSIENLDKRQLSVDMHLMIPSIFIEDLLLSSQAELNNFSIDLAKSAAENKIDFQIATNAKSPFKRGKGKLQIKGFIHNFLDCSDAVAFSKLSCDLTASVESFPTFILDAFYRKNPDPIFTALLGNQFDANAKAEIQNGEGPLDLDIYSQFSKSKIFAYYKRGIVTLREPATAQLQLQTEYSHFLFRGLHPFFMTAVHAYNPIVLQVSDKGFAFPIPFKLENLHIANATLDMGKIQAKQGGALVNILEVFRATQLICSSDLSLWFTPVNFSIKKGTIFTDRMDVLIADNLHICTWGDINLTNDQLHITVGIPADALAKSFGLPSICESYVFPIPLRGTTRKPKIRTGKVLAQIATLASLQAAQKESPLLGGMIGKLQKEEKAPAPKKPFPWEDFTNF